MKILLSLLFVLTSFFTFAQQPANDHDTTKYLIVRNNGIEYVGEILSDDGREILLITTELGKIYIPKSEVKSITKVDLQKDYRAGEFLGQGVFTTRYQFTTNAFPIQKGENYTMVNLYGPEVHLSVAQNFSVGVMATWIASPIALAFKYTIPTRNPKLNFGLGTLLGSSGYLNQGKGIGGLHWAMATYGSRRTNATLSLGFTYLNNFIQDDAYYTPGTYAAVLVQGVYTFPIPEMMVYQNKEGNFSAPIIGISGITAVGKKASFVWDAMIIAGNTRTVFDIQPVDAYYEPFPSSQPIYIVYGEPLFNDVKETNVIFMPGMRFQKDQNRAFQVTLAGVIGKREVKTKTESFTNDYSFPIPMLSWFYKF